MHGIIHIHMKYLTNTQYFYVVESGVHTCQKDIHIQCASAIRVNHIIHIMILSCCHILCVYYAMMFYVEWIHVTCQGKEACNILTLVEDRSGLQSRSQ